MRQLTDGILRRLVGQEAVLIEKSRGETLARVGTIERDVDEYKLQPEHSGGGYCPLDEYHHGYLLVEKEQGFSVYSF